MKQEISRALFVSLGVLSAAFGIEGFLLPIGFIDGGVTGISMLLAKITSVPLSAFILLVNFPFLVLAYKGVGKKFAFRSFFAVGLLAITLWGGEFPTVTNDKLLTAIFGGMFLGAGIGLAIRGGAVLDGTEVLALLVSRRSVVTVGTVILIMNILIFSVAALVLGVEPALYSILTYAAASKTIDFVLHGLEEYYAIMILSPKVETVRSTLVEDLGRSVTRFIGKSGLSDQQQDILMVVVTRLQVPKIKHLIRKVDDSAFVIVLPVSDVLGGVVKPRAVHRIAS